MGNLRKFKKAVKNNHNSLNGLSNNYSNPNNKPSQTIVITPELFNKMNKNPNLSINKTITIELGNSMDMNGSLALIDKIIHRDERIYSEIYHYVAVLIVIMKSIDSAYRLSYEAGMEADNKYLSKIEEIYKKIEMDFGYDYLDDVRQMVDHISGYGWLLDYYWETDEINEWGY
ncbi:MAG: hypothetical protein WAQ98_07470 [Blastocatellia bacterium]